MHFVDVKVVSTFTLFLRLTNVQSSSSILSSSKSTHHHSSSSLLLGYPLLEEENLDLETCIVVFYLVAHPLRSPRLARLVPIVLRFRDGGIGVVASKCLSMAKIICGLFTSDAPLCAMFRITAIFSVSWWWRV